MARPINLFHRYIENEDNLEQYAKALWKLTVNKLKDLCKELGITKISKLRTKKKLIERILLHKKTEKQTIRKKVDASIDFNELMGIKHLLPGFKEKE